MLDTIFEKTQVLIRRIIILPGRAEVGRLEHIAVLEAMRRGDADEAERLRRANMRSARAYLERYQKYVL
jgi:DNA-binding GntR family transcriptional regulator